MAAEIILSKKACSTNPLKSSTPLGAALAYLGIEGALPLLHGSQGCTSFALVLAVRHFKEAIPLQTTAMNEATTILGGAEHLEEALVNIVQRSKPKFIGVASTALVETRGEDFVGDLGLIRLKRRELDGVPIAFAATPDFEGALEEGWAAATTAVMTELVQTHGVAGAARRVNILPGVHQTPGDIEELRDLVRSFGLTPTFLPDISGSLDGSVPGKHVATSVGGTPLESIRQLGSAGHTIAIGEHMRGPAEALRAMTGVPCTVLPAVTGLAHVDRLVALLTEISGTQAPPALRRQRSQLLDAMMDAHFAYSGRRIALAADPDLLRTLSELVASLGAEVCCAIASTKRAESLSMVPCPQVLVGDLGDLEEQAKAQGAHLLITHSHGRRAAERLGIPLYRVGFPILDRIGAQHRSMTGYRGTRQVLTDIANELMALHHEPCEEDFAVEGGAHAHA